MQGAQRDRAGDRVTRFVFTLNNWTQEEYDALVKFAAGVKWMIIGKETGENGTPHLQGACILGTRMAFSRLKMLTGFKRAHIETMRGRPEDSLIYCRKQDLCAFVSGTLPTPGKRNDLHEVVGRVRGGDTLKQLAADDEGGIAVVKFHKGLTILRSLTRPNRTKPPRIFWLWGATGLGKTRLAFKCGRALSRTSVGTSDDIWVSSGGLRWFDGYDGQTVAILDDFRNKHVTSFAFFLRLLDRFPMLVEFKGGSVQWTPQYIFITCPYSPTRCFEKRGEHVPEDMDQLRRRLTSIVEVEEALDTKELRRAFVAALGRDCGLDRLGESPISEMVRTVLPKDCPGCLAEWEHELGVHGSGDESGGDGSAV